MKEDTAKDRGYRFQKTDTNKVLALALVLLGIFLLWNFLFQNDGFWAKKEAPAGGDNNVIQNFQPLGENATQGIVKFKDANEIRNFLLERQGSSGYATGGLEKAAVPMATNAAMDSARSESAGASAGGAADYSQTNVQVAGVDEADFVKNDDKYIYLISGNELLIIDALDAKNADIISTTKFDAGDSTGGTIPYYYGSSQAREMFVMGDKLSLFIQKYERTFYFEKYDIMPRETYKQRTYVYIYDISDRKNPKLSNTYSVSGAYYQSRLKDGIIYLVTQDSVNYNYIEPPIIKGSGSTIVTPEVYYFDNPDENYQFNTITSLDLKEEKVMDSKSFLMGYANTMMVSENNIYIAYQKHTRWCWGWRCYGGERYESERFYEVVVPLLEGSLKNDINSIISETSNETERWQKISVKLSEFFVAAQKDEKLKDQYENMFEKIQNALEEYDTKKMLEQSKTVIHKIGIDGGKLSYAGKGEVDGSLLNQFSMDEFEGNLRTATTVTVWLKERIQYNNVYVLDKDMSVIGKLENLAKDERIYSTRFIGDKLYMVTFRQTDPFFVIDLSDAEKPKILGYLKIPGYSDYLHPYDETHVIGVGKETKEDDYGGVRTQGIKIALFDVSDFENPKEVDKVVIGEAGSDSAALHDHKAFLFSKTKNLLVLPVTEVISRDQTGMYGYTYKTWNGAYVFEVSTSGFDELGKVKHSSSSSSYFEWWNAATVQRSLYIDDNLYTISNRYVKINDLANELSELNSIDLPYEDIYGGSKVWPTGIAE